MNPTELMKACGSKSGAWDPISPEDWRWQLENGTPVERVVAWVKSKTIAYKRRSPHCVDADGHPLYIKHLAVELGWTERTARNVLREAELQGRLRFGKNRIFYRADVPVRRTKGKDVERNDPGQSQIPDEVLCFLKTLPEGERKAKEALYQQFLDWDHQTEAEIKAAWRAHRNQVEDTIYREIGLPKKRLPKRRPEPVSVQLTLPKFVHSQNNGSVHSQNLTLDKEPFDSVRHTQGQDVLKPIEKDIELEVSQSVDTGGTDRPTPPPERWEAVRDLMVSELGEQLKTTAPSESLCKRSARKLEGAPLNLLRQRIQERRKKIHSYGMVESLCADVGAAWKLDQSKEKRKPATSTAEVCWVCNKGIEPGSSTIDGAHFDCHGKRKAAAAS
jgi:hypothetical protein